MALGTKYKRTGDHDDQRVQKNLDRHWKLMQDFIVQGMNEDEASKKAYRIICGLEQEIK